MRYLQLAEKHGLPRIVTVQNPYSLLNRSFEVGMAEISQFEGLELLAYSSLAFGTLTGKYLQGARTAGARNTLFSRFTRYSAPHTQQAIAEYVALAQRHGLDPAQMALAFVRRQPFVASTLLGATTLEQLQSNFDSLTLHLDETLLRRWKKYTTATRTPRPKAGARAGSEGIRLPVWMNKTWDTRCRAGRSGRAPQAGALVGTNARRHRPRS